MYPKCLIDFPFKRHSNLENGAPVMGDIEAKSPSTSSSSSRHHRTGSGKRSQKPRAIDSSMRQHSKQIIFTSEQSTPQHFDMTQLQNAISKADTQLEVSRSRPSSAAGSNSSVSTKEQTEAGMRKERIKTLWSKVGKSPGHQPTKWDQALNPLLQKQKRDKILITGDSIQSSSSYFKTTVGGEVGGGSGFYGQPGNATMECDCGDDSCPQCNLMLNMGSGY